MSSKAPICIYEYGSLYEAGIPNCDGKACLKKETFDNLWNFILSDNRPKDTESILSVHKKGKHRIIKAHKYVGTIQTADGQFIEILPKIYKSSGELESDAEKCRKIFLMMLRQLPNSRSKSFQFAGLDISKNFPILEIYISNYLNEVERLVSMGLKKNYNKEEDNKRFLKGQLLIAKHISKNICDKTRFYVGCEEYSLDIPHNRIIVSTLNHLLHITKSSKNLHLTRKLLAYFEDVPPSKNLVSDFKIVDKKNRLYSSYDIILEWSRQILSNNGYTTFAGKYVNQALLFSAEELFQNFVAYLFKKYLHTYTVHSQHHEVFLVDHHMGKKVFRLKPDLYAEPNDDMLNCIILDTKWKNIDANKIDKNYLIDIKDIYQLYGYGRKYALHKPHGKGKGLPKLVLIYPYTDKFSSSLDTFYYEDLTEDVGLKLLVVPFNLADKDTYEQQVIDIVTKAQGL